jgi:hypothetical protein
MDVAIIVFFIIKDDQKIKFLIYYNFNIFFT